MHKLGKADAVAPPCLQHGRGQNASTHIALNLKELFKSFGSKEGFCVKVAQAAGSFPVGLNATHSFDLGQCKS